MLCLRCGVCGVAWQRGSAVCVCNGTQGGPRFAHVLRVRPVLLPLMLLLLLLLTTQAHEMCAAITRGDIITLRNLLRCNADPNSLDYDRRAPLHIAAADGNLQAVRCCGWGPWQALLLLLLLGL